MSLKRSSRLACAIRRGRQLAIVILALAPLTAAAGETRPDPASAAPAGRLARDEVAAAGEDSTLFTVEVPGRFSIRAESPSGVALQLVGMMIGPGEKAGGAGVEDGRLDVLLDRGVYKLRSFGAKGAKGPARLRVAPFRAAVPASRELIAGGRVSAELEDLQLRSYWVLIAPGERAEIDVAGRSLKDLRLWREGVDLVDLRPVAGEVEPKPGEILTRLRLAGDVEPGLYLAVAYGGPAAVWADGAAGNPLEVRVGPPASLVAGRAEGVLDASGSARFSLAPSATRVRLETSGGPAALALVRGDAEPSRAAILKTSREPVVSLDVPARDAGPAIAEVTGFSGQPFTLRALAPSDGLKIDAPGRYSLFLDIAGAGGAEPPATALLAAFVKGEGSVVESHALRIAQGEAWRGRFNLRGRTSLIFEIAAAGPVTLRAQGPAVRASLEPLLAGASARADGQAPTSWNVDAGFYRLTLDPPREAAGVIDMTFGQPGLVRPPVPTPERTAIDFGVRDVAKGATYQLFVNSAPSIAFAAIARKVPADLAVGPLIVEQAAAPAEPKTLAPPREAVPAVPPPPRRSAAPPREAGKGAVPPGPPARPAPATAPAPGEPRLEVNAPAGGAIAATDAAGRPIPLRLVKETVTGDSRTASVIIPASPRERRVAIGWSKVPAPPPGAETTAPAPALTLGEPRFFDLAPGAPRAFTLEIAEGGLYRVETLGRLKLSARLGTAFAPSLAQVSDNGPGHNALLQSYLRAGRYRVELKAADSEGRAGLLARRAELVDAGALAPGESGRAALREDTGASFSIEAPKDGAYRIELFTPGREAAARLEDAEGWPLTAPGRASVLTLDLRQGRYRLVAPPVDVASGLLARLSTADPPPPLSGHGPHPLRFGEPQRFQWREPADAAAPREPDRWSFALQGPSHVRLSSSEGMTAALTRRDAPAPLAQILASRSFAGELAAGDYVVEARAMGRNDRLDYTLTLESDELQPDAPRRVEPPASVAFTLADERIVSLSSLGAAELVGVLKDGAGRVIERLVGRPEDWSLSLSRRLPAGAYRLDLTAPRSPGAAGETTDEDESEGAPQGEAQEESAEAGDAGGDAAAAGGRESAPVSARAVELRLSLPPEEDGPDLSFDGLTRVAGAGARRLALPPARAGSLLVVAAESSTDVALALERKEPDGAWRAAGLGRGRAPLVAAPGDGEAGARWRAVVWPTAGAARIDVAARLVDPSEPRGGATLTPLPVEGLSQPVCAATVALDSRSLLRLGSAPQGLRQGSAPGAALVEAQAGIFAPQSRRLWFATRGACGQTPVLEAVSPAVRAIELDLPPGDVGVLTQPYAGEGSLRVWRARSTFGQPALDAGHGMGIRTSGAVGEALALSAGAPLSVWNARANDRLRVSLEAQDLSARPMVSATPRYASTLPAGVVQAVALPAGPKDVEAAIGAGAAAVFDGAEPSVTVWGGAGGALSRRLTGAWSRVLLLNVGDAPAPVSFTVAASSLAEPLAAGRVFRRFFGAAGSASLRVEAEKGDRLVAVGAQATFIADAGEVARGSRIAPSGPGELILDHDAGLVVAFVESAAKSPWPRGEAKLVEPPQSVRLEGDAMALRLAPGTPLVLTARSDAPVLLAFSDKNGSGDLELFPVGAQFSRYLGPGDARLDLYAAHQGALAGTLSLEAAPPVAIGEGVGDPVVLAPGAVAAFAFEISRAATVGVGLSSDPDRARMRLLDLSGGSLGEGVAQLRRLDPGRYVIEARAPEDGPALIVRPALVGLAPPSSGPPEEIARRYYDLVGLKPTRAP